MKIFISFDKIKNKFKSSFFKIFGRGKNGVWSSFDEQV